MNNDLISSEDLKEALNEIFDTVEVVTFDDIITIMDNAPTIPLPDFKEGYKFCFRVDMSVLYEGAKK